MIPFTTAAAELFRAVGISAFAVQLSVNGSYASTAVSLLSLWEPPMTKILPSTSALEAPNLLVGISAFMVHCPAAAKQGDAVQTMLPKTKPAKSEVLDCLNILFISFTRSDCCGRRFCCVEQNVNR